MKLKKSVGLILCAVLMFTGCGKKSDVAELTEEEKEWNAVRGWFENDMTDEDEFTDLSDYQHYARAIGLEKDDLLAPDMWEIYYSDSININKEIDGTAIYLIRLDPDKLLEVWAENNETTTEDICEQLGVNRDDLYYNFGYSANSIGYAKNHKDNKVSYSNAEKRIFGEDNGENRQSVFSTHFLKVNVGGKYKVKYESSDEIMDIRQRDALGSITKPKTYNYSDYDITELTPAFEVNEVGIKRIQLLAIPNGWSDATDKEVTDVRMSKREIKAKLQEIVADFEKKCSTDSVFDSFMLFGDYVEKVWYPRMENNTSTKEVLRYLEKHNADLQLSEADVLIARVFRFKV